MSRPGMLFLMIAVSCLLLPLGILAADTVTPPTTVTPPAPAADTPPAQPAPLTDPSTTTPFLKNEFVLMVVNPGPQEAGRFSIRTTGGDPTMVDSKGAKLGANKHLIFGGNSPWTSYTTIRIDGESYVVGGPTESTAGKNAKYGTTTQAPAIVDNVSSDVDKPATAADTTVTVAETTPANITPTDNPKKIIYIEKIGDIEVKQELMFVRGPITGLFDTVGISYTLTNLGNKPHSVGLRVLLDTQCGENDGAPFRFGHDVLTTANVYDDTKPDTPLPPFWQAVDDPINPTVVCQGTLIGKGLTTPNKLFFADWGTLSGDTWEPTLVKDANFIPEGKDAADTAMALLWNPQKLDAGKSQSYVSNFGIGYSNVHKGVLALAWSKIPADIHYQAEDTTRFTIQATVTNTGGFPANDVVFGLNVPKGLKVVRGDHLEQPLGTLNPKDEKTLTWTLTADGSAAGNLDLNLSATSTNVAQNKDKQTINVVVARPTISIAPVTQHVQFDDANKPPPIMMKLNLAPAEDFRGFSITIKYDPAVLNLLDVSRGTALVDNGKLLTWTADGPKLDDDGSLTLTGKRIDADGKTALPLNQANINLATLSFYPVATSGKDKDNKPIGIPITIVKAVLYNEKGDEIPVEFANGNVVVEGQVPGATPATPTPDINAAPAPAAPAVPK